VRRLLSILLLLCCGLARANLPPDSLARLDYTALVNRWGHVLDGYSYIHDALGLSTNILRDLGGTSSASSLEYDLIGQKMWQPITWPISDRQPIAQQMPAIFDRGKCPETSFLESTALRNCRCVFSFIHPVRIESCVQPIWKSARRVFRGTVASDA
jgi:hypothetical protein